MFSIVIIHFDFKFNIIQTTLMITAHAFKFSNLSKLVRSNLHESVAKRNLDTSVQLL